MACLYGKITSKHQTLQCIPSVVCVDKALGIYMVPKSKSRVLQPIDVQKCFQKPDQFTLKKLRKQLLYGLYGNMRTNWSGL